MSAPHYRNRDIPDSASIEKKDDSRLEGGVVMAPVLTAGTTNADAVATTIEDPKETARLIRKLDWHVLPICSVLYLFSFLDRLVFPPSLRCLAVLHFNIAPPRPNHLSKILSADTLVLIAPLPPC